MFTLHVEGGLARSALNVAMCHQGKTTSASTTTLAAYAALATVGSHATAITAEAGQRRPGPGQGGGRTIALSVFGPNVNTVKVREYTYRYIVKIRLVQTN